MFDNPAMYNPKWKSSLFKSVVIDNFKHIWCNVLNLFISGNERCHTTDAL